jgi:hypothetical protein
MICKDKSGEELQIISKPFKDNDKIYVVTKNKADQWRIKILENLVFEHGVHISLLNSESLKIICKDKLGIQYEIISRPFRNIHGICVHAVNEKGAQVIKYVDDLIFENGIPDFLQEPSIYESKNIDPNDYPYIVPYDKCILRETNEKLLIISFPYYDDNGTIVINVRDSQDNLVMYSIGNLVFKIIESIESKISESEFSEFKTGAKRSSDVDEYRYDLISPFGLRALAKAHKEGEKHPRWNNEKGFPAHDYLNHIFDHLMKFMMGDRNENHMGKIMWGASQIEHGMYMWPHLNEGVLRKEGCLPPDNPDNGYWKDLKK